MYRMIFQFHFNIGYKEIKFCAKEKGAACFLASQQQIILTAQDDALPSSVIVNGAKIL